MKAVYFGLMAFALSLNSYASDWPNKGRVLQLAQVLQERVELLDESLHELEATATVIEVVHHFEETVSEFVAEIEKLNYAEGRKELDHLREDIFLVYGRLDEAGFFNSAKAIYAWNDVLGSYIQLERSMDCP